MARNRKRRGGPQSGQRGFSPFSPLGHTAGRYRPASSGPFGFESPHDTWGDSFITDSPVHPLISTVLPERAPFQSPPRRGKRQSPTLAVRATARSSDVRTRSPFLNATMVTPQLTARALECAKRGIKREVLFALKKTGKGAKAPRRQPSKVKC